MGETANRGVLGELQRVKEKLGTTDSITIVFYSEKDGKMRAASSLWPVAWQA
jgi:hypothetical protein